jgi:deoxyribodipyrimidine photo-lyase
MYENGLFIFRRDLRVVDNNTLNLLHEQCAHIYPIFIFTPEQVSRENPYKSDAAIQFMLESLDDLEDQTAGKLQTFYGKNERVIVDCIRAWNIDVVAYNLDYSPYALRRDKGITELCKKMNIPVLATHDYYLHPPGSIVSSTGTPYQKFTPYYETAIKQRVEPHKRMRGSLRFTESRKQLSNKISLQEVTRKLVPARNENLAVRGGRDAAMRQMQIFYRTQSRYSAWHNDMAGNTTSHLSAYIKFGCVSIREVYAAFRNSKDFIRQLIWRDFYANILYAFPHVLGKAMKPNYERVKWRHNAAWFKAWCEGRTGYPIVDAGMRQLNETGWMHNRARLITASFLVKTLLISWEQGERFFARKLVDYDPASNNGNWQWVAGTGADSQPYFRIFNPTEQGKQYDPECEYIKKWVPELRGLSPREIHRWNTDYEETKAKAPGYPKPICDYREQKEEALKLYAAVFRT